MTRLNERFVGATTALELATPQREQPVYTRYCAAPHPAHPIGEPRLVHLMVVATWVGRLIDPLPHRAHRGVHG